MTTLNIPGIVSRGEVRDLIESKKEKFINFMTVDGKLIIPEALIEYLEKNKFFTQSASLKYHNNYPGGLFDHCMNVAESLVKMTNEMNIEWQNPYSPYIVGFFHDLCKIDDYEFTHDYDSIEFTYNEDKILKGHGDKSVMLLSQFINLTEEEILCIRFHMGAYNTDDWDSYDKAIRKYQTVLWTHTADMLASKVLEK